MTHSIARKEQTLRQYERKLARVTAFIASHLDERIETPRLAAEASMSLFHFHRVYLATFGETPADTLRRMRLERATRHLLETDAPLIEVGMRAGYMSAPAFTRAFKRFSGVSPGTFRRARHIAEEGSGDDRVFAGLQATIRTEEAMTLSLVPYAGGLDTLLAELGALAPAGATPILLLPPDREGDGGAALGGLRIGLPRAAEGAPGETASIRIEGGKVVCLKFQDSRRSAMPVFAAMLGWRDSMPSRAMTEGRLPLDFLARLDCGSESAQDSRQWRVEIVLPIGPRSIVFEPAIAVL
ncbi:MAG: AraC family transcriptional regulator [Beijerinckiaceae bacterium]|nr:AraC family transcriptional regulator [Beijerinckiaceae bacterium]